MFIRWIIRISVLHSCRINFDNTNLCARHQTTMNEVSEKQSSINLILCLQTASFHQNDYSINKYIRWIQLERIKIPPKQNLLFKQFHLLSKFLQNKIRLAHMETPHQRIQLYRLNNANSLHPVRKCKCLTNTVACLCFSHRKLLNGTAQS